MLMPRAGAAVVRLPDGKVLIAGGESTGGYTQIVEIFDPETRRSQIIEAQMIAPRAYHTATLLGDGKVLLVGGENSDGNVNSAELFDPERQTFTLIEGNLITARSRHSATLLPDGSVLITGGRAGERVLDSTERYDPENQIFIESGRLTVRRAGHSAVLLPSGELMIAGGNDGENDLDTTEVGNSETLAFSPAEIRLPFKRAWAAAQFLEGNGTVMFAGGNVDGVVSGEVELYNPHKKQFAATNRMRMSRTTPGSALVTETQAMIFGGRDAEGNLLDTIEAYLFSTIRTDKKIYRPGQLVKMIGRGWEPGETVEPILEESPEKHDKHTLTAVADENGRINNEEFIIERLENNDSSREYTLIATGRSSGRAAQAVFKDAVANAIYRSRQTGNWNSSITWEISTDGGSSFSNASDTPGTNLGNEVRIRNGHTVTLDTSPANAITQLTVGEGSSGILTLGNNTTLQQGLLL